MGSLADITVSITPENIDNLFRAEKFCTELLEWQKNIRVSYEHYTFMRPVVTPDMELLKWYGWFRVKFHQRRWGFKLEYKNKYEIRAWDMAMSHWCPTEKRTFSGVGQHMHYYKDEANTRATDTRAPWNGGSESDGVLWAFA